MSTPTNGLQPSFTLPEIQAWIETTNRRRDDLYLLAAEPLYNTRREWALREMSQLLAEAIEEVRVSSASLQDDSQALRSRAATLRHHSHALIERGRSTSECLPQCVPSPQEVHEAERRVLDMFREDARHAEQS
jgi:hypothetical protein